MEMTSQQVCDDLMMLVERVKNCAMEISEARGITKMQMFVLYSIDANDGLAMGKIAEYLHCDASNVTGIVDRLVSQGLVVRQECETDRRAKQLRLTDKGRTFVKELRAQLPSSLGCDSLTSSESQALHNIIQKICV